VAKLTAEKLGHPADVDDAVEDEREKIRKEVRLTPSEVRRAEALAAAKRSLRERLRSKSLDRRACQRAP
jgi:hypothetical protein